MDKKEKKNSSFWNSLLIGVAGVALGIGAKFLVDEVISDLKEKENPKNRAQPNADEEKDNEKDKNDIKYFNLNENINRPIETKTGYIEYESFLCPISQEIMTDPVITPQGISYDRKNILDWLKRNKTCPITKSPLLAKDLITNYSLKNAIEEYLKRQDFKNY